MNRKLKLFLLGGAAIVVGLGVFIAVYHNQNKTVPLSQLVTPDYWIRLSKGSANFDPDTYMLYRGNPKYREVALTIDDGPHAMFGQAIMNTLAQYRVPATFFVVGARVKQEPEQVREMVLQGHEVGNHTYDHQRLYTLKPHMVVNELKFDDENVYRAAGVHLTVMRPPGERFNDEDLQIAKKMGYVTVNWTSAAKDYTAQTPDYIVRHIVDSVGNGSILLLHQDNPASADAMPRIIVALQKRGYRFVTVSTMLAHLGVEPYASLEAQALKDNPKQQPMLSNGRANYSFVDSNAASNATGAK